MQRVENHTRAVADPAMNAVRHTVAKDSFAGFIGQVIVTDLREHHIAVTRQENGIVADAQNLRLGLQVRHIVFECAHLRRNRREIPTDRLCRIHQRTADVACRVAQGAQGRVIRVQRVENHPRAVADPVVNAIRHTVAEGRLAGLVGQIVVADLREHHITVARQEYRVVADTQHLLLGERSQIAGIVSKLAHIRRNRFADRRRRIYQRAPHITANRVYIVLQLRHLRANYTAYRFCRVS